MKFVETELPGVITIEPDVYRDQRGFFLETYHERKYTEGGVPERFVQDNHSFSARDTLRGLHAQLTNPQGKLVRVVQGAIFDVAVDIRRGSPMFGRWTGTTLSGENFRQIYVPPDFAHGFCVLSERAHVEYKCTAFYDSSAEITVRWDDTDLNIDWPVAAPVLSTKDSSGLGLAELMDRLPVYIGPQ